jgi:hypothetical protein
VAVCGVPLLAEIAHEESFWGLRIRDGIWMDVGREEKKYITHGILSIFMLFLRLRSMVISMPKLHQLTCFPVHCRAVCHGFAS